ncbi:hypothetical protein H6G06_22690 [Anabaena sphaerica FACHB-251]|uniref:Uncharacterized protein n=1 Tax=Anabaena sphaerica FACHB-251 TaxID=2692883 RepID=A0A927A2X3_9NOST|nr:hypothetical protein [Anabaena sphaerica]MBD2296209.1 hypothetical protein [Anabaena sphaerica FACHB-251]
MSYSDFTLETVKKNLHLNIFARDNIFADVEPLLVSDYLQETLAYNVPFALASNTEKSRSEMIITPILLELTKKKSQEISLFSGVEFNIDPSQGLSGNCDFIITRSPEFLLINAPVIFIVEAKKENIKGGLGQCIAEMYAAKLFNEREENEITEIYGVVTTGEIWKFLKLSGERVQVDLAEYFLNDVPKIMGILTNAVK